jgi:hypothetical protein
MSLPPPQHAGDVRAADLQEKLTKRVEDRADSPTRSFRSDPTKTAAPQANIASERSEPFDRASEAINSVC